MALFPWKKKEEDGSDKGTGSGGSAGGGEGGFDFSPEKAKRFFDHARTLHEATNFGYAMNMWVRGLRFEPTNMGGMEGFFNSSAKFFTENAKGEKEETFKQTLKDVGGRSDVDKYLTSLVQWSSHPTDPAYAVKAMEQASNLGLPEPAVWIAERAMGAAVRDKKPRKEHLISAMKVLQKFEKFEMAVKAGEAAVRIDPTDAALASEVKNLSAEWTTRRGGFDQTGQEGGFRSNLRDAQKQREIEEQGRVVTTEETLARLVASARADYETSPNDRPNALKFIDALLKRGQSEDEEEAFKIASAWFEKSKEYRFRETADSIRVKQLRRRAAKLKAEADKSADPEVKQAAVNAAKDFMRAEIQSLQGQVEAYPTDLTRKFELAQRYYRIGKYEEAIALLQEAKGDAKNKSKVLTYLGMSFQKIGWNDEAIETIRQAMQNLQVGDEAAEMELKYALMEALLERAKEQSALADAEEAYKLASAIAIQSMTYKDVRARRDEIKALVAKLKTGTATGG